MKKHYILLLILAILVLIWLWLRYGQKVSLAVSDEAEIPGEIPTGGMTPLRCALLLMEGSRGIEVKAFQAYYNDNRPFGLPPIETDGILGPITMQAARDLSGKEGLMGFSLDDFGICRQNI
ncbi:MAG: hypothetical protein AAFR61_15110 [Bacteroidota bacterium]